MLKTVGNPSVRSGDQTILNGNLIIGTAGNGIDFSAAAHAAGMTSELLDDYEEGTWTPGLDASGGGGAATLSTAVGTYTKIGRMVFVSARLNCTAAPSSTDIVINNLPYTSDSTANYFNVSSVIYQNVTYVGSPVAFMNAGTALINLCSQDTTAITLLNGSAFANNATVTISFSYHV
jgi:hypothetical protein